jgi:hypothetical protein
VRTVSGPAKSFSAISSLECPSATHAIISRSRAVSPVRSAGAASRASCAGEARNRLIRVRVATGERSDSPAATVRTPASSASAVTSLPRKPLAPALSAWATYSSISNVVRISTRVPSSSGSAQMVDVAARPSVPGIRMSITTRSGRWVRARATA